MPRPSSPSPHGPPPELVRSLIDGPAMVTAVEWFDQVDSTNRVAADAARAGAAEGLLVLADTQTAGRGRMGREWVAPPGTSLLLSLLLRPHDPDIGSLPLLAGLAVADTLSGHLPEHDVAVKWPNDVLVDGRKAAGILMEAVGGAVVVGIGIDVDWRGVARPPELATATSVAEVADRGVDRWRVLAGVMGVCSQRYAVWQVDNDMFLPEYRERCATLGQRVRVHTPAGGTIEGVASDVVADGALVVETDTDDVVVTAGDVEHLRPA